MSDIIEVDVDGVQLYPVEVINDAEIEMTVTEQIVEGGSANLQTKSVSFTPTESAQSSDVTPDVGYDGLSSVGVSVAAISSSYVGSGVARKSSSDLTASGATVNVPAGYYESAASKSIASGSATTPATTVTANPTISVNSSTGVITASASATKSVTPTVSAGYVSSGTAGTITVSGSNTSALSVQSGATINPTESEQTAVAAGKYTTGAVKVGAIPSTYVGSGITSRSSTDLSVSGDTVTAPAGYYAASASKAVASGTAGTPTATKGAVSNHAISVTPSVTNTTGYITGSTKTGTAVSVSASELVSGTKSITSNGESDVTNYQKVNVAVPAGSPTLQNKTVHPSSSDQSITADVGYDGLGTVTAKAVTTTNLTAANIVSGVTVEVGDADDSDRILSVMGTASGGGLVASGTFTPSSNLTTYTFDTGINYTRLVLYWIGGTASSRYLRTIINDFSLQSGQNILVATSNNTGSGIAGFYDTNSTWGQKSGTSFKYTSQSNNTALLSSGTYGWVAW